MDNGPDKHGDRQCLDDLLTAIVDLEHELEEQGAKSDGLNVFEVLGITNTEIRHSNVIAWLMRPGDSHGLGGAVLSELIGHAGGNAPADLGDFRILRESDNIDILAVSASNRLTLAIENKVWSGEHDEQLARYQATVERRYPTWEHLYLLLSPSGMTPEGDTDREIWLPIDYGMLLGIVEDALGKADPSEKARMFIGDYIDSVRRHIVGDESLQERCVEIYLEHKRAIDLIMRNLPDDPKVIHQYALDWARRQEGIHVVDECSHGKMYVRFRTHMLEERFPAMDEQDPWGQHHFWFYEIVTRAPKSGVGCALKIQLSFYIPKRKQFPPERAEAVREFVTTFAGDSLSTFFGSYSGCVSKAVAFSPGQADLEGVGEVCDRLWADFLEREGLAIRKVFG